METAPKRLFGATRLISVYAFSVLRALSAFTPFISVYAFYQRLRLFGATHLISVYALYPVSSVGRAPAF